jgi:hypothetical protein
MSSRPFARSSFALVAVCLVQLLTPNRARAQLQPVLQYNYGRDISGKAASGVGAGLRFPLRAWNQTNGIMGVFTFDYFFPPDYPVTDGSKHKQTYWELNMNGTYDVPRLKVVYIGGGLSFTEKSVDYTGNVPGDVGTHLGIDVLAGLHLGSKKAGGFVQGRAEIGGGKQFVASAGIYF